MSKHTAQETLSRLYKRHVKGIEELGRSFQPAISVIVGLTEDRELASQVVMEQIKHARLTHAELAELLACMLTGIARFIQGLERRDGYPYSKKIQAFLELYEKRMEAEQQSEAGEMKGEV